MEGWHHFVPLLGLVMLRPFGMLVLMPMFSARSLGGVLIRNAVVLVMALPALPMHLDHGAALEALSVTGWVMLVLQEMTIGLLMGFCASVPFWAIDVASTIIDTVRGSSMASVLNPLLEEQSSVFGVVFTQVIAVLFLATGGFNAMLTALYESYRSVPMLEGWQLGSALPSFIAHQWQLMLQLAIGFALPSIVVMVLVDAALGLVNRSAQQLNVFFIAMPIKSALALFVLAVGMPFALGAFSDRFAAYPAIAHDLLRLLR
ncbi:type III secretion system export apparatus subunit SctT [Cupriavidus sp. AU9028]|uniref:type III secretion system export apparatus subunit SctT n=1 Tax=Cupriavidus sp. AU9028 TaxID=2871157 RepID=UPI001C98D59F|nr:type III secretion system export apparatus subunit SctT [Cupriavidus sp. AU9028]